jgi:hypothetical protein
MLVMSDQLDVQVHVNTAAIRRRFQELRANVAVWQPAPMPKGWK